MKRHNLIGYILSLVVLTSATTSLFAGTGRPMLQVLDGSLNQLKKDSFNIVQDSLFFDPSYNSKLVKPYLTLNRVTFRINESSNVYLQSAFTASVRLAVATTASNGAVTTIDTTLTINYRSDSVYTNRSTYAFRNAYKVQITVLSVSTNVAWNVWQALIVENEIKPFPVFNFSCTSDAVQSLSAASLPVNTQADELPVSWGTVASADVYDLEWMYADSTALAAGVYGTPGSPNATLLFDNNASRVTIPGTSYNVPLLYDGTGTLFFRVRSVQLLPGGGRAEAHWSSDFTGGLGSFLFNGHQRNLNWQASTNYAEDGKRKSVIQYYDGSLRSRQTVTRDNTTDTILVEETFYDYQGKPVIHVLPAPGLTNIIGYAQNFNMGLNGAYDKGNFDTLPDPSFYCSARADSMVSGSGSARYYSGMNPSKNYSFNQYIPDAGGYPFSQVEYTPDNTGRISRQGEVGAAFQLGVGHEAKYSYGSPEQHELDALFGTEAGDHSHYYKSMIRDANGQYSITYADMHGHVVATALAGTPPDSIKLDKLSSNIPSVITEVLADSGSAVIKDLVMESSRGLLVPLATTDTFTYILNPASLTKNDCNNVPVCYDCLYDLEITITDDCNNQKLGGQPFDTVVHNFSLGSYDTTCGHAAGAFSLTFTKFLQEGSYQVTKKLSVSRSAMSYYRDSVFARRNTCRTVTQMINTQKLFQASITQCQPTCQSCNDSLGTWSTFQQRFMQRSGISPSDSANYRDQAYQAYLQAQADCKVLCGTVSEFDDTRNAMLLDLTPPSGQYANPDSSNDIYSIFYTKYNGSTVQTPPDYTLASGYLNGDGELDSVYDETTGSMVLPQDLSSTAFTQKFKLSWAEALLPSHPEYCKLVRYQSLANSSLWDNRFNSVDTYAQALAKGYLNPTGNAGTPFNKYNGTAGQIDPDPIDTCGWFNFKTGLEAQLQAYTATGSNATSNHPTSMWAYASAMVTCGQTGGSCFTSKANNDSAFNSNMCTGDLDMAWRNFRQLYQDAKRKLINDQLKVACSAPSTATLVAAHHTPHFSDGAELLSANGVTLPTSAGDTTTAKSQGAANASAYYIDNCTAYASMWWKQLAGCNYTSADSAAIVPQLIQVCKEGSDADHPFGASSVAPSSTYKYRSFRDVLQHFSDSTHKAFNNINACSAYSITDPPPYDRPRPYSDIQVRSTPGKCQCDRINNLYAAYQLNNQGYGSFSAYVNGLNNTSMTEPDLQALRTMCTAPSSTCTYLAAPITIPAPLQCGGDQSCITCTQMAQTYSQFLEDNPTAWRLTGSDSTTLAAYTTLFANYFNARLGYKKQYADYISFLQQCSIPILQPVLGASILPGPVVPASSGTGNPSTVRCDTLQSLVTQFNALFPSLGRFNHGTVRRKATFYPAIEYMLTCSAPGSKIVNPPKWVGSGLRSTSDTTQWFRDSMTFVKFDFSRFAGKSTIDSILMRMSPVLSKPFDTLVFWCNMGTNWDTTLSCGQLNSSFTSNTLTVRPPGYQYFTSHGHLMYAYTQTTALSRFVASSTTNLGHILTSFLNTQLQSHNSATFLGSTDSIAIADPEAKPHMDVYYRMDTIFQCKDAVAAWFNSRLNTNLSYDSLVSLYHSICGGTFPIGCAPFVDTLKLCGRSQAVFPTVTLPTITSCSDSTFFSVSKGTELYNVYSDSLNNNFDSSYRALCMQAYKFESFTVKHSDNTYHYTLYYYDQAGNLLKTVPPEGVHPVRRSTWLDSVQVARNTPGAVLVPAHTLITQYRYNSIDHVIASQMPDAGKSNFWYDRVGRVTISQDSRQRHASGTENGRLYSYTLYDALGRIDEIGQISNATTAAMTDSISRNTDALSTWLNNSIAGKSQITQTLYDLPYTGFSGTPLVQRNLRNRVSFVSFTNGNNPNQFNQASFFTYDIQGSVDTLLQDYGSSSLTGSQNVMNSNGGRWKKMVYQYDLYTNKTSLMAYQPDQADQFYQRYTYDAENRLMLTETSTDSIIWEKDERRVFYNHGPLARKTLGDELVQGMDFAYTLQGWLKGINSTSLNAGIDMGGDGQAGGPDQYVARDALGFSLNYFGSDYSAINNNVLPFPGYSAYLNTSYKPLYNGSISSSTVNIGKFSHPVFYNYSYDQLNRLTGMDVYSGLNESANSWSGLTQGQDYMERAAYDENGNILKYLRNGSSSQLTMDSLSYNYQRDGQGLLVNNQLNYIRDRVNNSTSHSGNYPTDIDDQASNNYTYDSAGHLTGNAAEGITSISWNVYGKIMEIQRTASGSNPVTDIQFGYDAPGNRISKRVQLNTGAITYTWYVRDGKGNVIATYVSKGTGTSYGSYTLGLTEQHIYGTTRICIINRTVDMKQTYTPGSISTTLRGTKYYEMTNHLDNVLALVSDKKNGVSSNGTTVDYYTADVVSANDYYPFGMLQPGRSFNTANYRYGFNGKEMDNEPEGTGNELDYGMRVYDPRVGRFLSIDPLNRQYPHLTPYQFASNTPVKAIDLDGKEKVEAFLLFGGRASDPVVLNGQKAVQITYDIKAKTVTAVYGTVGGNDAIQFEYGVESKQIHVDVGSITQAGIVKRYGQIGSEFPVKGAIKAAESLSTFVTNVEGVLRAEGYQIPQHPNVDDVLDAIDVKVFKALKEKGLDALFVGSRQLIDKLLNTPEVQAQAINVTTSTGGPMTFRIFENETLNLGGLSSKLVLIQYEAPSVKPPPPPKPVEKAKSSHNPFTEFYDKLIRGIDDTERWLRRGAPGASI